MTGVSYDIDILQDFINFVNRPNKHDTIQDIKYSLNDNYDKAIRDYEEYTSSKESIIEDIEANDYSFTSDGKIY